MRDFEPHGVAKMPLRQLALQEAHADGLAIVSGDATRRDVLRRAGVVKARQVIITTDRDDSTVLSVLNVTDGRVTRPLQAPLIDALATGRPLASTHGMAWNRWPVTVCTNLPVALSVTS